MKSMSLSLCIGFASLLAALSARADNCTTPDTSIAPEISSTSKFDKKSGRYTYNFNVRNDISSQLPIDMWWLLVKKQPSEISSPANWTGDLVGKRSNQNMMISWSTTKHNPSKSDVTPPPGQLEYPSYSIKPGTSLGGFVATSTQPPGLQQYWASGFTYDPTAMPSETNDEPEPNCPGWDFENSKMNTLVTGMVTGPSSPDVISVPIRFRDEQGEHSRWPMHPSTDTGKVSVLVLSTRDFDVSQLDLSSLRFGPGKAAPLLSKLIGRRDDDDREQEREDWEKQSLANDPNCHKTSRQNLLLTFDLAVLEVQCVLDRALFLTGKTLDGKDIIGGVSTKLTGCDLKKPPIRPYHRPEKTKKKRH